MITFIMKHIELLSAVGTEGAIFDNLILSADADSATYL